MNAVSVPLLDVVDLTVYLPSEGGDVRPVDHVTLSVSASEILGLVGESGCGKSMTALAIMRLLPALSHASGAVRLEGRDLLPLREHELQRVRGRVISMVFQEPMTSLDPVFTIGHQVTEAIRAHRRIDQGAAQAVAVEMLERVGFVSAGQRMRDYPHELSGGMRQRVMIAMALIHQPKLLIADEPTTAVDVTIQAEILDLIRDLQQRLQMGVLLISHDLAVVAQVAQRVAVMYAGEIVEIVTTARLFRSSLHPYTQALLRCIPGIARSVEYLHVIEGRVPDLRYLPPACRFAPRCPYAIDRCWQEAPQLERVGDDHYIRCWNPQPFLA